MKLKQLIGELQGVQTWRQPKVELEQYPTPPDVAAHMLFAADAQGDLQDALVADLGCGGAILGIGVSCPCALCLRLRLRLRTRPSILRLTYRSPRAQAPR